MTVNLNAMNARGSARSEESQPEPDPAASLGSQRESGPSQPAQAPVKKTIAALDRNIEACELLLARYPEKIAIAHRRKEATEVVALEKEREKLIARKEMLERLRLQEVRTR